MRLIRKYRRIWNPLAPTWRLQRNLPYEHYLGTCHARPYFTIFALLRLNLLALYSCVYAPPSAAEYSSNFFSSQRVLTVPLRYSGSAMTVFKNGISVSMPAT